VLNCTEEVMIERIMKRAETSGRNDDNMDALKKRFGVFENETKPIIDHYDK